LVCYQDSRGTIQDLKDICMSYEYYTEVPLIPDLESAVDGEEHSECGYFKFSQIQKLETGEHLNKISQKYSIQVELL